MDYRLERDECDPLFGSIRVSQDAFGRGDAINNQGTIVGLLLSGELFLYKNGKIQKLDSYRGLLARGINEHNDVVGCLVDYYDEDDYWNPEPVGAFIWSEAEGRRDLNTLIDPASGWVLLEATGINNSGQICGNGFFNGHYLPFRLDPVKHPKQKVPTSVKKIPTPGKKPVSN